MVIRDDQNNDKNRGMDRQEDIGRRTRSHGRTLLARVYLTDKSILLVRGSVDPDLFRKFLCPDDESIPAETPNPGQLGFSNSDVIPLSRGGLASRARSIQRWRNWVEKRIAGRTSPAELRELRAEWQELELLGGRVAELHDLIGEIIPQSSPFWLEPEVEQSLIDLMARRLAGLHVTKVVSELARMICWLKSLKEAGRFIDSVREGLLTISQFHQREAILRFKNQIIHLQSLTSETGLNQSETREIARLRRNQFVNGGRIRDSQLIQELRHLFASLPESVKSSDQIYLPSRDRDIDLQITLDRTLKVLDEWPKQPEPDSIRWLALFCLTDNSTIPISWAGFARHVSYYNFMREFWKNRLEQAYEDVLKHLNDIEPYLNPDEARNFMVTGGDLEDLKWLNDQGLYDPYKTNYGAAVKPFRSIVTWLRTFEASLTDDDCEVLWNSIASEKGCHLVESIARFLGWMTRPNRQQVGEITGLVQTLSHPSLSRSLIDRMHSWANPPKRSRLPAGCPDNLPAEITLEVRRLAFYQRMAGQQARIPGSIRNIFEARSRQITELEHLKSLGAKASPSQSLRLSHLSIRIGKTEELESRSKERILRQIREVSVITALTAARELIRDEISRWWLSQFGIEPDLQQFRWQEQLQMISWAEKLETRSKDLVISLLKAYREHGPAYRQTLPGNAEWLCRVSRAIKLEQWHSPEPLRFEIGGETLILKAASHPVDIFLMGSRFDTCLSIHDGHNALSVIANAADANKAVIYAWRADGTPVARKLVAIRPDGKMVGFRIYAHEPTDAIDAAFARFCGIWAARAGMGLANSGEPASISGNFWYNDGTISWTEDTYAAYREIHPEATFEIEDLSSSQLNQLHQALGHVRKNSENAIDQLELLGQVWPNSAAYWCIRTDLFNHLPENNVFKEYVINHIRDLIHHLSSAGFGHKLPHLNHRKYNRENVLNYWSEAAWSTLALVPPGRDALCKGLELLMHLPSNAGLQQFSACFAACRISPAYAILPFRKLLQLLSRFSGLFVKPDCGCNADAWKIWAYVLHHAWIRQPDPAAFANAFDINEPIISQVLFHFCQISPDRRFSGPIRRQLRSVTDRDKQAKLREIRSTVHAIFHDSAKETTNTPLESIAFDSEMKFPDRLQAIVRLVSQTEKIDPILGTILCSEWSIEERAQLPLEICRAFADEMAIQTGFDEWKTWPLLHWLACLPEEIQCDVIIQANSDKRRTLGLPNDDYSNIPGHLNEMSWNVITHALEDSETLIRQAAETVFRMTVQRDPRIRDDLLSYASPWIWPETYERLNKILEDEQA